MDENNREQNNLKKKPTTTAAKRMGNKAAVNSEGIKVLIIGKDGSTKIGNLQNGSINIKKYGETDLLK